MRTIHTTVAASYGNLSGIPMTQQSKCTRSSNDASTSADSSVKLLTAMPVYNEAAHVQQVLDEVIRYAADVLVVDDGSTDGTLDILKQRKDVILLSHEANQGYGAALRSAFEFAVINRYDVLVTIDCDGQHEPQRIGQLVDALLSRDADIASGSRYLDAAPTYGDAPVDRRRINMQITEELNCRFGFQITDAFCGFKAYRVRSLASLELTEPGYAMPLEVWVQIAHKGLRVVEAPVPLIYLDEQRSFGGALDNAETRLQHYHRVIDEAVERTRRDAPRTSTPDWKSAASQRGCSCP